MCKPCNYTLVEAVGPFKLHPMSMSYIWEVCAPFQVVDWHLASHSHRYHHRHFPRFVRVGWNPTWYKCANKATMLWLSLWNLSNCIPFQCHTYMRLFSTFSGCGGAYGFTLTPLPPQLFLQIWESWLKSTPDASVQSMPLRFDWGCRTFQTASLVHVIPIWGVWGPSQVVDEHMASHSHCYHYRHSRRFVRVGLNPPDASVQTMPLRFDWGCKTFQTASYVYAILIWEVLALFQDVDGHMALCSHQYHQRHFPRFVKIGWNPTWCKCANDATIHWLRLYNLLNCIPCPCHTYMRGLSTFSGCGLAYGFTFTLIPPQTIPQICESWLKSYLMQVCKQGHYVLIESVEPFKLHTISMPYIYEVI